MNIEVNSIEWDKIDKLIIGLAPLQNTGIDGENAVANVVIPVMDVSLSGQGLSVKDVIKFTPVTTIEATIYSHQVMMAPLTLIYRGLKDYTINLIELDLSKSKIFTKDSGKVTLQIQYL